MVAGPTGRSYLDLFTEQFGRHTQHERADGAADVEQHRTLTGMTVVFHGYLLPRGGDRHAMAPIPETIYTLPVPGVLWDPPAGVPIYGK